MPYYFLFYFFSKKTHTLAYRVPATPASTKPVGVTSFAPGAAATLTTLSANQAKVGGAVNGEDTSSFVGFYLLFFILFIVFY